MRGHSLYEKILRLHQLDGSVSWRALAYFKFVKEGIDYTSDELERIKEELLQQNLIEFADEKRDATILTVKGRQVAQAKSNRVRYLIKQFFYGKWVQIPMDDIKVEGK